MFQVKVVEKIKTHSVFNIFFLLLFFENRATYEIMFSRTGHR